MQIFWLISWHFKLLICKKEKKKEEEINIPKQAYYKVFIYGFICLWKKENVLSEQCSRILWWIFPMVSKKPGNHWDSTQKCEKN